MKKKHVAKKLGIAALIACLAFPSAGSVSFMPALKATAAHAAKKDASSTKSKGLSITKKTYKKVYKTDAGNVYKETSFDCPVAAGNSKVAAAFNHFYQNLKSDWIKNTKKDLAGAKEIVLEYQSTYGTDSHYFDKVTYEITCNDQNYVSILHTGYEYTLGAHGMPYRYSYVFNAKTGQKLSAAKILGLTKKEVNTKVRNQYVKKYKADKNTDAPIFFPFSDAAAVRNAISNIDFNDDRSYMKNGKLRFYVYPYTLGPYASGFIEVAFKL